MSSGSFKQVYVECPFYRFDNGSSFITCEGVVEGGSTRLYFPRKQDFEIHIDTFCCNHYDRCELFRALVMMSEEGERLYKDGVYYTGGFGLCAGAADTAKPACNAGDACNRASGGGCGGAQNSIPCTAIFYRGAKDREKESCRAE